MIAAWLRRRDQKRQISRHASGWNWAAGELLRGKPIAEIEAWAEYGFDFDGPNDYDRGIRDACRQWSAGYEASFAHIRSEIK